MPISLKEFIREQYKACHSKLNLTQLNQTLDDLAVKMHRIPPLAKDTIDSSHFDSKYKAQFEAKDFDFFACHLQRLVLESLGNASLSDHYTAGLGLSFFGSPLEPAELHVLLHAMYYELTDLGGFIHRAAYAAVVLYDFFEGTPINVLVKSTEKMNIVLTYIGNKELGWYIYDPVTAPDFIYEQKEYQNEVLNCVNSSFHPEQSFMVKMEPFLKDIYRITLPKFRDSLQKNLAMCTIGDFLENPYFMNALSLMARSLQIRMSREEFKEKLSLTMENLKLKWSIDEETLEQCDNFYPPL